MSGRAYSEIYLHIVWRTKENFPMIQKDIEEPLYNFLRKRCAATEGVYCHSIGGTDDHLHLCVSAPPTLLLSDWIGDLKGASSHYINHEVRPKSLQWQTGYGVVSFGKRNLKFVKDYVENQKRHHATGKVFLRLEQTELAENKRAKAEDREGR